jgi:nucleotide-binding universal stress UspA family protein
MGFKKIVVPVDFSEFSDKAVEYAIFLAEKFCAELILLHAVVLFQEDFDEKEQLQAYEEIIKKKEREIRKQLDSRCLNVEERGIPISSLLIRGFSEADSIIDYIADKDFDLVVMGTHGHTGLKKIILGSVAERVVRLSPVPVLTLHKDFSKKEIKKILVPVDFSDYSKTATQRAITVAREFNAALNFLHVVEMEAHPEYYTISFDPILKANPELKDRITANMTRFTGIPQDEATYAVNEGKVYKEIKTYADTNQVDLIVMATRGMSEIEHFLVGSNSERVVRIAPCPVLTIGQKD